MRFPDGDPVTKSFLIKALITFLGFVLITVVPLTFKVGGMLSTYEKLSAIPTSDIIKAIDYSVKNQPERKEFYRNYIEKNNLKLQSHEDRLKIMEEWSRDIKSEIVHMRRNIESIEKTQLINNRILTSMESKIDKKL